MCIDAEIRAAAASLVSEFAWLIDHGRASEAIGLFTEDAVLTFAPGSPKPGIIRGKSELELFLAARQAHAGLTSRHIVSNLRLGELAGGRVEAHSVFTVYRSESAAREPMPAFISDVEDTLEKESDGAWRIAARTIRPIFARQP